MYNEDTNDEEIYNEPEYNISSLRSAMQEEAYGAAFGGGFGGGFMDACDIGSMSDSEVIRRARSEGLI